MAFGGAVQAAAPVSARAAGQAVDPLLLDELCPVRFEAAGVVRVLPLGFGQPLLLLLLLFQSLLCLFFGFLLLLP